MPEPVKPICPKCGYDQSGEIATWEERCPLEGVCPECGLAFAWADVFDPSRVHLPWYVEHAERKRDMLRRTPGTFWLLILPNRFWKRVTVGSPIYVGRLWSYVGGVMLAVYLGTSLIAIGSSAFRNFRWNQLYTSFQAKNPGNPLQGKQYSVDMWTLEYWSSLIGGELLHPLRSSSSATQILLLLSGMVLLWAVIIAAVPTTRRIAQVRFAHVHRALTWSGFAIACLCFAVSISDSASSIFSAAGLGLDPNWPGLFSIDQLRFRQAEMYSRFFITGMFIAGLIWIQWFWIAAIVRGWQIRSVMLLILGLIASLLAGFTVFMYLSVY
ncbi:MAG: hypothetical protein WD114_05750 [Phycisphaerales bacterium]